MAAIAHAVAAQATAQTTTSSSYADVSGASIASGSFTAGKKYLIVATAACRLTTGTGTITVGVRCLHGSTAFAESELLGIRLTPKAVVYQFMTVWTAISGEGIKLQFKSGGGETFELDTITLVAINLSDDLNESTDWFYAERTTDDGLSTAFTDGAILTFTPAIASHDWLVLAYAQIDPGDTTTTFISRLERSGEASGVTPEAVLTSISATHLAQFLLPRVFTLGAASNTFKERAATGSGTAHTRLHSSLFALNLNKFRNHAFAYTDADTAALSTTDYADQVQTLAITPDVAGDVLILGYMGYDINNGGGEGEMRVQVDNVDQPAGQTTANHQFGQSNNDAAEQPLPHVTMPNLTAAAHTIDMDASQDATQGGTAQHRLIAAFTMELPAPGGGGSGGGAKYYYDNMMRDAA